MAKTVRTDELQLRITIDGTPARAELAALSQDAIKLRQQQQLLQQQEKDLRTEREKHEKGSKEYKRLTEDLVKTRTEMRATTSAISENTTRQEALRKEIGLTGLSMKELDNQAKSLRAQLRNLVPGTDEYNRLERQLLAVETRMKSMGGATERASRVWAVQRKEIQLTDMTLEQLDQEYKHLQRTMRSLDPNSEAFRTMRRDASGVRERIDNLQTGLGPFGRAWQGVKTQVMGAGAVLASVFAGGAILSGMKSWVTGSADLSDAQADVQRTTGLTKLEVQTLTKELGQLNTRTARAELLALASDAGKLGITGKDNIMQFVRAGDQIRVALGEDLGEDAIKQIGKINATFNVGLATGKDLEGQMLATGSAINALGQSSTADESFLVDFTTRMAGVNTQANINVQSTLGYAAALDQLGQRSETSSTALSQFTLKAFKDTGTYAKIAGMGLKEFQDLLKTDTNEALLRTLEGLKGNNEGLSRMTGLFSDMGQEGARAVGVLASLANNTKLVRDQQKIANEEFTKGTSITTEFTTKNNTLAGNLEVIGKRLMGLFVNNAVVDGINRMANAVRGWIEIPVSETLEQERLDLQKTYAEILIYNTGNETRTKLIKQLQDQYPGFLANIDAEKVGNEQLTTAVKALNEQLVNKIILQKKDEEIEAQNAETADRKLKALQQEDVVREKMVKLAEANNIKLKEGVPLLEQARDVQTQIEESRRRAGKTDGGGVLFNETARLGKAVNELSTMYAFLNSEQDRGNKLIEARTELLKRLGIAEQAPAPATPAAPGGATPTTPAGDPTDEEKKAAEAKRKEIEKNNAEIRQMLEKAREDLLQAGMTADEKELRQLDVKHKAERKQVLDNAQHTAADLQALDDLHANERANAIEAQGDRRAQAAAEAARKVTQAEQDAQDQVYLDQLSAADREIQAEMEKMDRLVSIYEKAGIDTQKVVERTEKAIAATKKKYAAQERADAVKTRQENIQQQVATYQAVGSAIGGVNSLLAAAYAASGQANYENTTASKTLGLAQIAIASGVGVAEAIKAGAGLTFPANLGAIATGVGAVLTGIANAITLLNSTSIQQPNISAPQQQEGIVNGVTVGAKGIRSIDGPDHANGGLDVVDPKTGQRIYNIEGGETLVAKDVGRANPELMDELMAAASRSDKRLAPARTAVVGGTVGMALGGLVGGPVGMAIGGAIGMAAGGAIGMAIPVKKQKNSGFAGPGGSGGDQQSLTSRPGKGGKTVVVNAQRNLEVITEGMRGTAVVNASAPTDSSGNTLARTRRMAGGGAINGRTGGGVAPGNLHSEGGNDVVDNRTGQVIANVERDELLLVMSRKATAANADLIPLMLEASRKGARLPMLTSPVQPMDFAGAAQAMRAAQGVPQMAQGGLVRGIAMVNASAPGSGGTDTGNDEMLAALREQNDHLKTLLRKTDENTLAVATNRNVVFRPDRDYDRSLAVWQKLKDRNTAKRRRA